MDPNKVVNEVTTTVYMNNDWSVVKATPQSGLTPAKMRVRTYADGRVIRTVLNDDGSELSQYGGVTYDDDQRKIWQQDQTQANRAGGASSPNESVSAPTNQPNIVTRRPDGSFETTPNPNYQASGSSAGKKTEIVTGPGGNSDLVTWEIMPDGSKGRILEQRPATKAEIEAARGPQPSSASGKKRVPVDGFPGVYQVTEAKKSTDGGSSSETSETYYEDEQGNRVAQPTKPEQPKLIDLPNGQKGSLIPDPSQPSGFRVEPIAGTEKPKGAGSAIDVDALRLEPGRITTDAMQQWKRIQARMDADPSYTRADAEKDWNVVREAGNARIAEIQNTLSTQSAIYGQESANYRAELDDTASRRNFAATTFGQAQRGAEAINPYVQPGSDAGGKMLLAQLALGAAYSGMMGGNRTPTAPTMGAGLQQAKGITIDLNNGQVRIGGGANDGGAAPGPIGAPPIIPQDPSDPLGIRAQLAAADAPMLQGARTSDPAAAMGRDAVTAGLRADPWFPNDLVDQVDREFGGAGLMTIG